MTEEVQGTKRVLENNNFGNDLKKTKYTNEERASKIVQEHEVGITQYINNKEYTGFSGLLKQFYTDFLVNEIDINGKVVRLTDEGIDLGKTKKERKLEKRQEERADLQDKTPEEVAAIKEEKLQQEENKPKYELSEENRIKLLELITEEELAGIEKLFSSIGHTETKTQFNDKKVRGQLHQLLRESFQGKLETVTSPENTFRIALAKNSNNPRRRNPQESINHVDENGVMNYGLGPYKNYLHFTVFKENRETMEVASTISKFLRVPSKSIRFAGTKDRRGVTCQRFAIHKGKVARVSQISKGLKNVALGGFAYEDYNLDLGDLQGNEFLIAIRDVKSMNPDQDVKPIIDEGFNSLQNKGFINYYGMQRFGTFSISTHTLGIKLLNEDWKGAVDLILSEQDIVAPDSQEARSIWAQTANASMALKKMPHRCTAEYCVLQALTKEQLTEDEDYSSQSCLKSIMSIPRNLRVMYGHAYQSYIWNLVTSKRIEMFGLNVTEGDLVLITEEEKQASKDAENLEFEEDVVKDKFARARPLTKEDIDSGKYTIYDVVLPLPGFDVVYPENEALKQIYIDEMGKDGLDPFKMARRIREFSLAGSYRNIMSKPKDLLYDIIKYNDDSQPLMRTDLDILHLENKETTSRIITPDSEGDKTAVILKLQLGVSSYATMALREFMKADTARLSDNLRVIPRGSD